MSQYGLQSLKNSGIRDIAIIIGGENSYKVKEYYGDGQKFGVQITYIEQDYPKGISHAIGLCQDFIGTDKFVVFLGDNVLLKDISNSVKEFQTGDETARILLCEVPNPSQFGIAQLSEDGSILKIMEKPKNPPTNLAVIGIYLLTPYIFDVISKLKPSWRNELEITDALQMLLELKQKITYDVITHYWKDTGTQADIIDANGAILSQLEPYFLGKKENGVEILGKVMIGRGTEMKTGVSIQGPVIIGENCVIGHNVHIGPNTSIGNNCKIDSCNIENSIIMDNCEINCSVKIRDSIISYNTTIRSSSTKNAIFALGDDNKIIL
jgi:glucose-1-phosphate thymidylyltransferase